VAPKFRRGVAVRVFVRADAGQLRAVGPKCRDERPYAAAACGLGLPHHDDSAMRRHLNATFTDHQMAHFCGHPELAGLHPRSRAGGRMRMLQAISVAHATRASAELDHAGLSRVTRRPPVRLHIAICTTSASVFPPSAVALDPRYARLGSRRSRVPHQPDCSNPRIHVHVSRDYCQIPPRQPARLWRLAVDHATENPRHEDFQPAFCPAQFRRVGTHIAHDTSGGPSSEGSRAAVRPSRASLTSRRMPDEADFACNVFTAPIMSMRKTTVSLLRMPLFGGRLIFPYPSPGGRISMTRLPTVCPVSP